MDNKKELQNNQRVYFNSFEKRLNDAVSPAGGIAVKLISVMCYKSIIISNYYLLKNYYTGALPLKPHFILLLG
jgi:hypothetical protein